MCISHTLGWHWLLSKKGCDNSQKCWLGDLETQGGAWVQCLMYPMYNWVPPAVAPAPTALAGGRLHLVCEFTLLPLGPCLTQAYLTAASQDTCYTLPAERATNLKFDSTLRTWDSKNRNFSKYRMTVKQGCQNNSVGKNTLFSKWRWTINIHIQKNEVGIILYPTGKHLPQVESRSKCKS